jgi:hypothetical protein
MDGEDGGCQADRRRETAQPQVGRQTVDAIAEHVDEAQVAPPVEDRALELQPWSETLKKRSAVMVCSPCSEGGIGTGPSSPAVVTSAGRDQANSLSSAGTERTAA